MVFSVSKGTTDQAVTPATWTKLTWPNVILDTSNNFANDRFTPTVAGKYIFIISAYCKRGGSNDLCSVSIRKSGVEIAKGAPGSAVTVLT